MIKVESMESMTVDNNSEDIRFRAPINPFMQDLSSMGTRIGTNVVVLH